MSDYPQAVIRRAMKLADEGMNDHAIAQKLQVPRTAAMRWTNPEKYEKYLAAHAKGRRDQRITERSVEYRPPQTCDCGNESVIPGAAGPVCQSCGKRKRSE